MPLTPRADNTQKIFENLPVYPVFEDKKSNESDKKSVKRQIA